MQALHARVVAVDEDGDVKLAAEQRDEGGDVLSAARRQHAPALVEMGASLLAQVVAEDGQIREVRRAFDQKVVRADEQVLRQVVAQGPLKGEGAVTASSVSSTRKVAVTASMSSSSSLAR